jgi:hypothetical protein
MEGAAEENRMPTRRVREVVWETPSPHYLMEKARNGWTLVALEWEHEVEAEETTSIGLNRNVPYGLKIADDALTLAEDPEERRILTVMLDLIVKDEVPLSKVARELNGRGYRTRTGSKWTQSAIFEMLPRLVEVAPTVFTSEEWEAMGRHL